MPKNILLQNDSHEKLDIFSDITIVYRNSSETIIANILIVHHDPLKVGCLISCVIVLPAKLCRHIGSVVSVGVVRASHFWFPIKNF